MSVSHRTQETVLLKLLADHPRIAARWSESDWHILAGYFPSLAKAPGAPQSIRDTARSLQYICSSGDAAELLKYLRHIPKSTRHSQQFLVSLEEATIEAAAHQREKILEKLYRHGFLARVARNNPAVLAQLLSILSGDHGEDQDNSDSEGMDEETSHASIARAASYIIAAAVDAEIQKSAPAALFHLVFAGLSSGNKEIAQQVVAAFPLDYEEIFVGLPSTSETEEILVALLIGPLLATAYELAFDRFGSEPNYLVGTILPALVAAGAPTGTALYDLALRTVAPPDAIIAFLYAADCPITRRELTREPIRAALADAQLL